MTYKQFSMRHGSNKPTTRRHPVSTRKCALSQPGQLQGEDMGLLRQSRLPWALPIYDWCLDYLVTILPFLHFVGILTLFWLARDKIRGGFLIIFSFYYSVIW